MKGRETGFYQVLQEAVEEYGSYDAVLEAFTQKDEEETVFQKDQLSLNPLGDQAEIMLRTMLMRQKRGAR